MDKKSYIYSVEDKRNKITEIQLCLSHVDILELRRYCEKKDIHRNRGFLQGDIVIGRNFVDRNDSNNFSLDMIKSSCYSIDPGRIQETGNVKWYKMGLRVSKVDYIFRAKHHGFLNIIEEDEALLINCDRHYFESFFQYIKGFTEGYWGDVFDFSPNFRIVTCIHDYNEEDLNKLNEYL